MFGPEMQVRSQRNTLVMRAIEPEDLSTLPTKPFPEITEHLIEASRANMTELFSKHEESEYYQTVRDEDYVLFWGIFDHSRGARVLVGSTALYAAHNNDEPLAKGWQQTEGATYLYDPIDMGRGIATDTHAMRSSLAFAMGIDMIRSTVHVANTRSLEALYNVGYVPLRGIVEQGHDRIDARLYHGGLVHEEAIKHALATADEAHKPDLERKVTQAMALTDRLYTERMPEVEKALQRTDDWARFLATLDND